LIAELLGFSVFPCATKWQSIFELSTDNCLARAKLLKILKPFNPFSVPANPRQHWVCGFKKGVKRGEKGSKTG
jgi:hypothetical protein